MRTIQVIIVGVMLVVSITASAHSRPKSPYILVPPVTSPAFCKTFKHSTISGCHLHLRLAPFLWPIFCHSMPKIYHEMMHHYHRNIVKACRKQDHGYVQGCINGWHCYMYGGRDRKGQLCSGTGQSCIAIMREKKLLAKRHHQQSRQH